MKKLNLIISAVLLFVFTTSQAQTTHSAIVLGIVPVGNFDVAAIHDLETGDLYKTATYKTGLLTQKESVELSFKNNEIGEKAKVVKVGVNQTILAFIENYGGGSGEIEPTYLNKPRFRLKHRTVSPDGVKSQCNQPKGTCLTISWLTEIARTGEPIDPLNDDEGTATMQLTVSKDGTNTGTLSFIYDQPTALDDGTNPVFEEEILSSDIAEALGYNEVKVLPKNYVVDFSTYQYGEIIYDVVVSGKLKAKIRTNVPSNSSNPLNDCNVCPQKFKIVNSETVNVPEQNFGTAEISFENNKLHLVFDQATANQNGEIIVSKNFEIGQRVSRFIGFHNMIISKGTYQVDFSNSTFGEVFIDIKYVD